jgi:hypothetical protein
MSLLSWVFWHSYRLAANVLASFENHYFFYYQAPQLLTSRYEPPKAILPPGIPKVYTNKNPHTSRVLIQKNVPF